MAAAKERPVFRQQIGPSLDGLQVAWGARQLVSGNHARADLRAQVQLDKTVWISPTVRLAFGWTTDDRPGTGNPTRRLYPGGP